MEQDPKAEAFDKDGSPRKTVVLEDGEVFYGSENEYKARLAEKREEKMEA